jgi:hypothetical protein
MRLLVAKARRGIECGARNIPITRQHELLAGALQLAAERSEPLLQQALVLVAVAALSAGDLVIVRAGSAVHRIHVEQHHVFIERGERHPAFAIPGR